MRPARVVALVPAAGQGARLAAGMPKAFVPLRGRPLLWHAVHGLWRAECVDEVVVAVGAGDEDRARSMLADTGGPVRVVCGGAERTDSVRRALAEVPDAQVVLVHDAARCLAPPEMIRAVAEAVLAGRRAVVPVLPVVDTIKRVEPDGRIAATMDRASLRVVQTPQGFAAGLLRRAQQAAPVTGTAPVTDDAGLVERLGEVVATVPGHPHAFKITTPFDLVVAEALAGQGPAPGATDTAGATDTSGATDAGEGGPPGARADSPGGRHAGTAVSRS